MLPLSPGPGVHVGRTLPRLPHLGGPAHALPWLGLVAGKVTRVKINGQVSCSCCPH